MNDALGYSIGIQTDQKREITYQNHRALCDEGQEQPLHRLREAKVDLKGIFEENDHCRSVEWVCTTVDEKGVVSDEAFMLAIGFVYLPLIAEYTSASWPTRTITAKMERRSAS